MMQKKNYNDYAITLGTLVSMYFLQKYANFYVVKQAEKDIQKAKSDAYGPNWSEIDYDVQKYLILSGKNARGEKIDDNEIPTVQKTDVDKYVKMPIYNPNFYRKYEFIVPIITLGIGIGLNQQKKYKNLQNIGNGLIGFGVLRGIITFINKTPKTFDMMYQQTITMDKNPNKFYSGYVYDKNSK